jgi:ketosteroid isomerase-like protein
MRGVRSVVLAALVGVLVGVGPACVSGQVERIATAYIAAVELPAELAAVLRAYESAWAARDAAALAALFTADGFVLRPGHPPVRGRDGIRQAYANSGGPLVLTPLAYETSGTVGYIVGTFARQSGEPALGKFVLALRRDSGAWLIYADMDNDNGVG